MSYPLVPIYTYIYIYIYWKTHPIYIVYHHPIYQAFGYILFVTIPSTKHLDNLPYRKIIPIAKKLQLKFIVSNNHSILIKTPEFHLKSQRSRVFYINNVYNLFKFKLRYSPKSWSFVLSLLLLMTLLN